MKIAFNMVSASHGGGFETYNKNILDQLFKDKLSNEYYIFTNNKFLKSYNKNIHFVYISNLFSKSIMRLLWMQFIFPFYLIFNRFDIIFSPMNIMPIILKLSKIKNVLVIHSNLPWLFPDDVPGNRLKLFLQLFFTNISIKISDKIIVDSLTAKTELCCIFKNINNKTTSVYLGIDHNSFISDIEIDIIDNRINIINDSYFLTIASAVRYHCLIELIDAYELLCTSKKDIPKLLIISKNLDLNYFNEIFKKIELSKYSDKIIFLENIDSRKIPTLYKNASLYIFSSYCEVFGFTNLEAMVSGIPVITSNKSAIPEICGDAAIYFDPLDPIDIKNKIMNVYCNEVLKKEIIRTGYNQVKKYSWEKTFLETNTIIKNI